MDLGGGGLLDLLNQKLHINTISSTLRNYNGGILTSITYGFGKFLEHFAPWLT